MVVGSDQGTVVTVNDGASWSSWYNQPTGQFYHAATDDRFPYWIYSGQQDSGTVAVASRSDYGQLTFRDWHPVGGDGATTTSPSPAIPTSSTAAASAAACRAGTPRPGRCKRRPLAGVELRPAGDRGPLPQHLDHPDRHLAARAARDLPRRPGALPLGRRRRELADGEPRPLGATAGAASTPDCATGDLSLSRARICGFGTISTIAPSPLAADQIWVGTDDGLIRLTRDGGKSWQNVTPPGLAEWSRLAQIDASPTSAGTAYAAVDRHRLDDFRPYAFVTHDFGKTWRAATAGLPDDAWVGVVRQDPKQEGLLFAGTSRGAFVSFDDGAAWQPLQLNLPTTGINDLTIHGDDLIAATEGRSISVLDGYSPLRHLNASTAPAGATLFPPATAYRVSNNQNRDTPLPLDEPRALNPPAGAVFDYLLPTAPRGPVTLEVLDAQGEVVRRFASDDAARRLEAGQYFAEDWLQPPSVLPARPGHNRFAWDLRGPRPLALEYEYSIAAVPGADTPELPQGLFVCRGATRSASPSTAGPRPSRSPSPWTRGSRRR